ncbi:restriction endonuclease subunit S [Roseivirga sp. BDSF3-8]|uniref:restriction endonuclease subunit S n=1 Tax=Roseivirga sp. BDSF3-8 TaxID=3241598 RepID=UPI0035319C1A
MSWQYLKLGDVISLKRGYDLPANKRVEGEVPVISSSGTSGWHCDYKCDGEGVVTGRYGTLGEVFYVNGQYWPLNTTLYVSDFKGNHPRFIFYYLKTIGLERFNGAAAVPGLDRNILHRVKVKFPTQLSIQRKIASTLSAYDELIENNNQRISLLEETAEELYKEWFVRMRFPGYQEASFLNENGEEVPYGTEGALPEGWVLSPLKDWFSYSRGKSYRSEDLSGVNGIPFVNLKNVNRQGGFRYDGTKFYYGKYAYKNIVGPNDVIMAVTDMTQEREIVGRVARIPEGAFELGVMSMDLIKITSDEYSNLFVYSFFNYSNIGHVLKEFANGANVLHLSPDVVLSYKMLMPPTSYTNEFTDITEPIFKEIDILSQKNQLLRETRDLLLPRLMSGKLDVSRISEDQHERRRQVKETAVA